MNEYDVVVVGGGAAGLSAALVLTRARRQVAVVDSGQPRNAPASHMQGLLGSDGLPPTELLAAGRSEVARYGGHLVSGTVSTITECARTGAHARRRFDVVLEDGSTLGTRRVLVTTGLRDEVPDVPGVRERWGRDLLHCPYCHGYEVRDQPLGVLAGAPDEIQLGIAHAHLIRQWSDDVVFFTNSTALTASQREQLVARAIGVVDEPVTRLVVENDQLSGVELKSGNVVRRTAVFVRPHFVANDDLLVRLGCATHANGWVAADATGRTSVPGVWAAGNAVNPRAQVITAAGEGSAAAIAINNDLVDEDLPIAVANFRRPPPLTPHDLPATPRSPHLQAAHRRPFAPYRPCGLPAAPTSHQTRSLTMSNPQTAHRANPAPPPTKHQLALMIWVAVFPTLTVLNLLVGDSLADSPSVLRTFVLATVAVPIVIYGLMPRLHKIRAHILMRRATA